MNSLPEDMLRMVCRNKLVGMWAAEQMGLTEEKAKAYSDNLAMRDFGRCDVLAILRKDFDAAGVKQSDEQIRNVMSQSWLAAGKSTRSTDASDAALVQIVRNLQLP